MQSLTNAPAGAARGVTAAARPLVTVVVPVFDEAGALPEVVRGLADVARALEPRYAFEFVLVDDGSSDHTLSVAEQLAVVDPRISLVSLRRNYGQTAAMQVGFEHARGAIVVSMDADLQHFPEDIPAFLDK